MSECTRLSEITRFYSSPVACINSADVNCSWLCVASLASNTYSVVQPRVVVQRRAPLGELVGHPRARWSGTLGRSGPATSGGRATSGDVVGHPRAKLSGTQGRSGRAPSGKAVGPPRGGGAPSGEVVGQGRATSVEVVGQPLGGRATSGEVVGRGGRSTSGEVVGHPRARWSGTLGQSGLATSGGRARWSGTLGPVVGVVGQHNLK